MKIIDNLSRAPAEAPYAPKHGEKITATTSSYAKIYASYDSHDFMVSTESEAGTGRLFSSVDCREAAEFFTKLAQILESLK